MKNLALAWIVLALVALPDVFGRTFTDTKGRKLEGKVVSSTKSEVVIKRNDGKEFTIKLDTLSLDDQLYVSDLRETQEKEALEKENAAKSVVALEEIVKFCRSMKGKQVGDGECWTLADRAFQKAKIKRPGSDMRVWGREIDYKKESPQAGDIVELEGVHFASGMRFENKHTSVIVKTRGKYRITVCEQNISGNKTVQEREYDLRGVKSGTVKIYRYEAK